MYTSAVSRSLWVSSLLLVLAACSDADAPTSVPTAAPVIHEDSRGADPIDDRDARAPQDSQDAGDADIGVPVESDGLQVTFPDAIGPLDLAAAPRGLDGTDARTCRPCHTEIYREWRRSLHRQSWTDPMFQAGYRRSPHLPCRRCHAPLEESDAAPADDSLAADEGVSCAVCHVRDGHVFGPEASGAEDHASVASSAMATGDACAPCHQFNFPGPDDMPGAVFDPHEPMQNTVEEWRRSEFADTPCQTCHMPLRTDGEGRRYRSHEMRARRNPELMRQALDVDVQAVRRGAEVIVRLTLRPGVVGHAVPTGDMFRALEIDVFPVGQPRRRQRRELTRHFGPRLAFRDGEPSILVRQRRDERVGGSAGEPEALVFRLRTRRSKVRYVIRHLAMPRADAARDGVPIGHVVTPMVAGNVRVRPQ